MRLSSNSAGRASGDKPQRGNVIVYVFLAVTLLSLLTYAYVRGGREDAAAYAGVRLSEELFAQAATLTSAAVECALEHPAPAAADPARAMMCDGKALFAGTGDRFLPPPPPGFSEWVYLSDARGARLRIVAPDEPGAVLALGRLLKKFPPDRASLDDEGCGPRCFTALISKP